MIKNKAAFTISKKINRLYKENYKNKQCTFAVWQILLKELSQAFGCFKVLENDRFERAS